MKRDPRLIKGMRNVCATGSDDDLYEFLELVYHSAFLGGFEYARRYPSQTREDAEADLAELVLRSSDQVS